MASGVHRGWPRWAGGDPAPPSLHRRRGIITDCPKGGACQFPLKGITPSNEPKYRSDTHSAVALCPLAPHTPRLAQRPG